MTNTITLYTFTPALGLPDPSSFVLKALVFLNMHGIEFKTVSGDVRKAPLKKIPYLEHNGKQIADSELILDYLEDVFDLTKDELSDEQHALGHMICRALEERTYWCHVYYRWRFDDAFAVIREELLGAIPAFLRKFLGGKIQKDVVKTLYRQGIARHKESDIAEFMRRDYKALSDLLGGKTYLFGEKASRYDATALAMTAMLFAEGIPLRSPDILSEFPNLRGYYERNKDQFFALP